MSSKFTPRIEHDPGRRTGLTQSQLARIGAEMYHRAGGPAPQVRLIDVIRERQGLDELSPAPAVRPGTADQWAAEQAAFEATGETPAWMG